MFTVGACVLLMHQHCSLCVCVSVCVSVCVCSCVCVWQSPYLVEGRTASSEPPPRSLPGTSLFSLWPCPPKSLLHLYSALREGERREGGERHTVSERNDRRHKWSDLDFELCRGGGRLSVGGVLWWREAVCGRSPVVRCWSCTSLLCSWPLPNAERRKGSTHSEHCLYEFDHPFTSNFVLYS